MPDMRGTVLHTPAERSVVAHGNGTRIERSRCNDTRYPDRPAIRPISQNGTVRASAKRYECGAVFSNLRQSGVVDMVKKVGRFSL
jgi:hypothetical protein